MNYLILTNHSDPFYTNWFDAENHFNPELEMVVFNLLTGKYTTNGKDWHDITKDQL